MNVSMTRLVVSVQYRSVPNERTVARITYTVLEETLNPAQSINQSIQTNGQNCVVIGHRVLHSVVC